MFFDALLSCSTVHFFFLCRVPKCKKHIRNVKEEMGCSVSLSSTARKDKSSGEGAKKYSMTIDPRGALDECFDGEGDQQAIDAGQMPLDPNSPQLPERRLQRVESVSERCATDEGTADNLSYFANSSAPLYATGMPRTSSLLVLHNPNAGRDDNLLLSGKNINIHRRTSKEDLSQPEKFDQQQQRQQQQQQQQQVRRRESLELGMSPDVATAAAAGQRQQQQQQFQRYDGADTYGSLNHRQHRSSVMGVSQAGISQEIFYQETIVRAAKENDAIEAAMLERAQQQQRLLSPKYRGGDGVDRASNGETSEGGRSQELHQSHGALISSVFQPLGLPLHQHSRSDQSDDLATPLDPLGSHSTKHQLNSDVDDGSSGAWRKKRSFNPSRMTFGDVDEDDNQTFTRHDTSGGGGGRAGGSNPSAQLAAVGSGGNGVRGGESYSRSTRGLEETLVSPTTSGDGNLKFHILSPKSNPNAVIAVLQVPTPEANAGLPTAGAVALDTSNRSCDHPLEDDVAAAASTRTFLMQALPPASSLPLSVVV
jgi:hypothetical protein